jgi:cation transport regulator ChaC
MADVLAARPPGAALRLFAYGALMWEAPDGRRRAAGAPARPRPRLLPA